MKLKIFFLVLLSIPQFLTAQNAREALEAFSRSALNIKGNVTQVTESHYTHDEDGNVKKAPYKKVIFHFNDKGQLTKRVKISESDYFFDEDTYNYSYDKKGRLTSIHSEREKELYSYSEDGKKLTRTTIGSYNEKDVYEMDERGRIKQWSNYNLTDDHLKSRKNFSFYPNSSLKEVTSEGSEYKYVFKYNGYSDVSAITQYDKKNNWLNHETFEYDHDRHSNWTLSRHTIKENEGESFRITIKRTYVYASGKPSANEATLYTAYVGFDPIPKDAVYYNMAEDYYYGNGVVQSYGEAARWYKMAAGEGNVRAMRDLGHLFRTGKNGPVNLEQSYKWYREAADKGDGYAMMKVGVCYDEGSGIQQDYAEAMRWYRKASGEGFMRANFYIGMLYKDGKGVPADKTEARKWLSESASAGISDAKKALQDL